MNVGSHLNWIFMIYVHVYTMSKQLLYITLKLNWTICLNSFWRKRVSLLVKSLIIFIYIMHANILNVFKKLPLQMYRRVDGGCGQCQTVDYDTTKFVLPDFRRMAGARAVTGRWQCFICIQWQQCNPICF